ncbi:hypothetical protein [Desulfitobacterium sp.]|uniref:hypothetical protein n=1 Tax=Desulfitobacterium sp. TaxID=49981 RepID=UPI002D132483|nr:hypothetical protein [Desulfitobacterium sp.]HVJ48151.1 hypothetical protein [Desulfitobacterium sp.]
MNETGLNIIPLLLFIVIIGTIVLFSARAIGPWMSQHISWKRNILCAGVYLAILIMLVPISYLLPRQGFMQPGGDKSQTVLYSPTDVVDNFSSVENPDQVKGVYKNNSQTFKLDTNSLAFDGSVNQGNYQILIKRKDVDDGEIEVSSYTSEQIIGDINFTKNILPPSISLQSGTLSIKAPSRQNLEFKQFMADFTVDQFKHLNQNLLDNYSGDPNWRIIYLRVPQSVKIHHNLNEYNVHTL